MKDFDKRNSIKKEVDNRNLNFFILPKEIRFTHLGLNVGSEQNGRGTEFKRPVLVLKKIGNVFVVLPMTTGGKDSKFYYSLATTYFGKISRIILSQIRVLDKARFTHRIATVSTSDFQEIQKKLKELVL